jgi:plasmid rolling circle replication initiator protein Rep
MWLARFHAALPRVLEQHPTARFVFLTLTQRNVPVQELRTTLRAMNKAWERLAQRKSFGVTLGWIRTTEVTRARDGSAHPHFHVLLMVPSSYFGKHYLSHGAWVEMWRRASRIEYSPVVDVRAVKQAIINGSGILPAVRETLKYSVKPSDMKADAEWFLEVTRQLRKLRFIASGGALKGVLRPEEESEKDLLLLGDADANGDKASMFFGWQQLKKRYKRARSHAVREL